MGCRASGLWLRDLGLLGLRGLGFIRGSQFRNEGFQIYIRVRGLESSWRTAVLLPGLFQRVRGNRPGDGETARGVSGIGLFGRTALSPEP